MAIVRLIMLWILASIPGANTFAQNSSGDPMKNNYQVLPDYALAFLNSNQGTSNTSTV